MTSRYGVRRVGYAAGGTRRPVASGRLARDGNWSSVGNRLWVDSTGGEKKVGGDLYSKWVQASQLAVSKKYEKAHTKLYLMWRGFVVVGNPS